MAKILFDIAVAHEPAEWTDCHLVVEISSHSFYYAVISGTKKLLQLRYYELYAHDNPEMATELDHIIANDELLKMQLGRKTFIYNFPESQLVPEKYFTHSAGTDLIELLHGDLSTGIVLSEKVEGFEQYNVYRVPAEIHGLLQRSFRDSGYWHYYSLWMKSDKPQLAGPVSYLSVLFYPNAILVSAVKDNQLHLLQNYTYEAAEDVGYYLLNICGQLQLPPENTTVVLSGMIEVSSVLYTEIFKYFGQVKLDGWSDAAAIPALQEYPPHFFSPLLKLATCVS